MAKIAAPMPDPDTAARDVLECSPRLIKVAAGAGISFALWQGANRAITAAQHDPTTEDLRQVASGYRGDSISIAAIRLALLLDADPSKISFQRVYRHLQRQEVVKVLVRRLKAESQDFGPRRASIQNATDQFLKVYRGINWTDLHGRLTHFRNIGLAHLTPQVITKRVSYAEIESLTRSVVRLAECLTTFASGSVPLREDELTDWSDRAANTWQLGFDARTRGSTNVRTE
jgi:hypothetical protein